MAGTSLLSDAELFAALNEAERAVGAIPDLDDGKGQEAEKSAATAPGADAKPATRKTPTSKADAKTDAAATRGRSLLSRLRLTALVAPIMPLLSIPIRYTTIVMAILDRPFARISPPVKQVIGLFAIVSLVASLGALLVMPRLIPRHDALTFLREKVDQMNTKAETPESEEPAPTGNADRGH